MNSQRIAVITDTGTDTPTAFAREHDVRIVPLRINFSAGSTFESGVTITPEQLVERMATEVPSTSLPSPATIRREFDRAHDDGYAAAVFVSISSGLSATCDTVRMLADQLDDFPVVVVDSKSIGVGAGLVVMEAVRMVEEGITLQYIGAMLELVARKNSVFFSVKSLEYLRKGGDSNIFNLGNGQGFSVKEMIEAAKEATGKDIKVEMGARRAGDPAQLIASSEKARKILGWNPRYTDVKQVIGTAWNWHQKHPNGYEK